MHCCSILFVVRLYCTYGTKGCWLFWKCPNRILLQRLGATWSSMFNDTTPETETAFIFTTDLMYQVKTWIGSVPASTRIIQHKIPHRFNGGGGVVFCVTLVFQNMILIYLVLSSYLPNSVSGLKRSPPLLLARSPARKRISLWEMIVMRWGLVPPPFHLPIITLAGLRASSNKKHKHTTHELPCGTSCSTSLAGASAAQWTILAVEDRLSTM